MIPMPLFRRHSMRTQALIEYFIEVLDVLWLNHEEANYLIAKIQKRIE